MGGLGPSWIRKMDLPSVPGFVVEQPTQNPKPPPSAIGHPGVVQLSLKEEACFEIQAISTPLQDQKVA